MEMEVVINSEPLTIYNNQREAILLQDETNRT